jgi:nucleotide-binding universal stress UspA family protein
MSEIVMTQESGMWKVLAPVDGSASARAIAEYVLKLRAAVGKLEVHLINVQIPIESGHARMFVGKSDLEAYYRDEAEEALRDVRRRLDDAGMPYTCHITVGHVAETIARYSAEQGFDQIVMGTHGDSALSDLLMGSVAKGVIHLSSVPVTLVK